MAAIVLKNPIISIDSVQFETTGLNVTIDRNKDMQDVTAFGMNTKGNAAGIKDWSMQLEFFADFTASGLDEKLDSLYENDTEFAIAVRATSAAVSTTNPEYQATKALVESYSPWGGGVGEVAKGSCTIKPGGPGTGTQNDLVRATA